MGAGAKDANEKVADNVPTKTNDPMHEKRKRGANRTQATVDAILPPTHARDQVDIAAKPWSKTKPPKKAKKPINDNSTRARQSQILTSRPLFFWGGAKSGFELCFGPRTLGAGPKHVSNPE